MNYKSNWRSQLTSEVKFDRKTDMQDFHQFLQDTKQAINNLANDENVYVQIALGNETCDMDSMVSAFAIAYYLYVIHKKCDQIYAPVLNMPRRMFPLRTENVHLLNEYGIHPECLIFIDEINLIKLQEKQRLDVILVDHHVLSPKLKYLKDNVVEIYDHRPFDTSENWRYSVKLHMDQVGSCCTIIYDHIKEEIRDEMLLGLLYTVIVFDTIGFKESAGKAQPLDYRSADALEEVITPTKNRKELFDEYWDAHNDVSSLTTKQMMYKDMKSINTVYIPGISMLIGKYIQRDDILTALNEFAVENKASAVVLMGLEVVENVVQRDLALYAPEADNPILRNIEDKLLNADLQLEHVPTEERLKYYKQCNTILSRKQVMPLIKSTFKAKLSTAE